MTELQVKAQQLEEERRHNKEMERIQGAQNQYTKEHYERSDTLTGEHYQRSDAAGLISANASAMNAETNRLNYQLQHDIEYLPTYNVDGYAYEQVLLGYGSGLPLSAQKRIAEIEQLTLNSGVVMAPDISVNGSQSDESGTSGYSYNSDGTWSPVEQGESRKSWNKYTSKQENVLNATTVEKYANSAGKVLTGMSGILNSTFGKGGIINTIRDLE